mgnify:FL=1
MIRNLEVNQSKIIDLNKKKRLMAQRKARARRRFKTRVGMALFALAIPIGAVSINSMRESEDTKSVVENMETNIAADNTIYADITDLNDLNLVLVNDGVNSDFFSSLSANLEEKGVSFETTNDSATIENMDGSETYISFIDYNSDGKTKVIGEYTERDNQTDPLAIGINSCLKRNNLTDMDVQCGIKGIDDNGYQKLIPSSLEKSIGDEGANRFVTIAVDANTDVGKFSTSLTEGLLRFQNYVAEANNFNLITRVTGGETLAMIAQKHGVSETDLQLLNNIKDGRIFADETLKVSGYSNVLTDKPMVINNSNTITKSY